MTHLSNPGVLQQYSGWTSLDSKITRRMSPRKSNIRTVEAKLSLGFVNNCATKPCVSGGTAPCILYLDTRCKCSASPTARSTTRKGDAGTHKKGGLGGGGLARQRNPARSPIITPTEVLVLQQGEICPTVTALQNDCTDKVTRANGILQS